MPKKKRALLAASLLEGMAAVQGRLQGKVGGKAKSEVKTKTSRESGKARWQSTEDIEGDPVLKS
jgi:hypothetical protein